MVEAGLGQAQTHQTDPRPGAVHFTTVLFCPHYVTSKYKDKSSEMELIFLGRGKRKNIRQEELNTSIGEVEMRWPQRRIMEACLEELSLRSRWGLIGRRGRARVARKCEVLGVSLQGLQKNRGVGSTRQIAASILCERNEDYYVSSEKVTQRYR